MFSIASSTSEANVTVATQQMLQLCLITVTFKVKPTEDVHFDHINLIYEPPGLFDRLRTLGAAINQMSACVSRDHFPFTYENGMVTLKPAALNKTATAARTDDS